MYRTKHMNKKKLITMVISSEGEFTKCLAHIGTHKILNEVKDVALSITFYIFR